MMWLLRLAALLAAYWFLRWLWAWLWGAGRKNVLGHADRGAVPPHRGTMQRDPVCGTFVDVEVSVREIEDGQTLYFCSMRCRDAHRARQPEQAVKTG